MLSKRKIINDPVYGFITISHPLIFDILSHPYYQRLRRIHQMALAQLVYPGAVHTRLHHSLGAYHLMCNAVNELRYKNVDISPEEETAVKAAILLHDIGHGPFSHALEHTLVSGVHHEELSLMIMHEMNDQMDGRLQLALDIFNGNYAKPFLYQLISGQLDVDRMDYLTRDSFFTGVNEGVIGYDRILKMFTVHNDQLMIEEKGIYSVEKFLIARRQMYWQVYLHKAVLAAEKMLVKIVERVKAIYSDDDIRLCTNSPLDYFLGSFNGNMDKESLELFCNMDDDDMMFAIKRWSNHPDIVLSTLCKGILNRRLLKCHLHDNPVNEEALERLKEKVAIQLGISVEEASFLVFSGEAVNTIYTSDDEQILVHFKNGTVKNISQVYNPLIHQTISTPVKKFYICELK